MYFNIRVFWLVCQLSVIKKGIKSMKNKYLYILGIIFVAIFAFFFKAGVSKNTDISELMSNKVQITTSFFPMAEFAKEIGGDKVKVTNLTPAGVEPHDFELTPQDIVTTQKSQLFIYNGAGFEAWVEKALPDLENSQTITIDSSKGINLLAGREDEHHHESLYDPHIWLNPVLAQQQVDNILSGMIKADPDNKTYYETNAKAYKQKLSALDQEFKSGLTSCQNRTVITSHNAFGYLAQKYNFDVLPISGISPDEEPSPKRLAEIADFAKANNVKYIFFETLVSPRLSQTIASEIGAQTMVFNPLEGLTDEETLAGEGYLSIQRENLVNLKTAMNCK